STHVSPFFRGGAIRIVVQMYYIFHSVCERSRGRNAAGVGVTFTASEGRPSCGTPLADFVGLLKSRASRPARTWSVPTPNLFLRSSALKRLVPLCEIRTIRRL